MPRPERPVDPSAGPAQQFAASLRKLRAEAGNPSYRQMASVAHMSKASLSAAASGHRLPSLEAAKSYVLACGGDVEEWSRKWSAVRAELGLPARDADRRETPAPAEPAPRALAVPGSDGGGTAWRVPHAFRPQRRPVMILTSVVLVVLTVAIVQLQRDDSTSPSVGASTGTTAAPAHSSSPPTARFDGGEQALEDNADPKKTGCGIDASKITTLDEVEVNTLNENLLGTAILRHAPHCRASWGKFDASSRLTFLTGPHTVTITAHRPATGTVGTPFTATFDGQPVFGNILLDHAGCVEITVQVRSPHGDGTATTDCKR